MTHAIQFIEIEPTMSPEEEAMVTQQNIIIDVKMCIAKQAMELNAAKLTPITWDGSGEFDDIEMKEKKLQYFKNRIGLLNSNLQHELETLTHLQHAYDKSNHSWKAELYYWLDRAGFMLVFAGLALVAGQ